MERAKRGPGDGVESLGASGPGGGAFEDFRRMESKIDQDRAEVEAFAEVDAALNDGLSEAELEQKFAQLEGRGVSADGKPRDEAIDDELERLKNKLRIEK